MHVLHSAGQGATMRHGRSMAKRSNADLRCEGRAIRLVATRPNGECGYTFVIFSIHLLANPRERSTAASRIGLTKIKRVFYHFVVIFSLFRTVLPIRGSASCPTQDA